MQAAEASRGVSGVRQIRRLRLTSWLSGAVLLMGGVLAGCGGQPQLNGDRSCKAAVDALWSAVSAREPQLLSQCEAVLTELHDDHRLSDEALEALERVIRQAREGDWQGARARLKKFIKAQKSSPLKTIGPSQSPVGDSP